ncbi:hypothetical protein D3C80_1712610 [compost metagenome]
MLTPAAALPNSTSFNVAIPAIECPIINGFSGKVSISLLMLLTMSINPVSIRSG